MHKHKKQSLKLGNLYIIEYNDHFAADRVMNNSADSLVPIVLRSIGKLVAVTPTHINLEHSCRVDESSDTYSHSIRGIMIPCVVSVTDLGPWPSKKRK